MRRSRSGFSLMEVLLSTSILVGSSIALIELATIGRKQANAAYDLNQAQLLCQAKLDEIVAGVTELRTVESQELEDDPDWLYSVELRPMRLHRLVEVKVSVFQALQPNRKPQKFMLVRWMKEPPIPSLAPSTTESLTDRPSQNLQRENRP